MNELNLNYNKIKFKKGDLVTNFYQSHSDKFKPYYVFVKLTKENYIVYGLIDKEIHKLGRERKYGDEPQTLIPVKTCYSDFDKHINVLEILNDMFGKC